MTGILPPWHDLPKRNLQRRVRLDTPYTLDAADGPAAPGFCLPRRHSGKNE